MLRDGQVAGAAEVRKEGLYFRIFCRCRMTDREVHRLYTHGKNLGVLIPDRGELVLETKVAAKRFRSPWAFTMDEKEACFVPIRPGEAFPYLDKIRGGKLVFRDGEMGMLLD